jgi:hypothetical protein
MLMKTLLLTLIAITLCAQAQDKAPTTAPDQGPAKFYGTISAVDAKAMTFTVDSKVYHVVAETQMTKAADGAKATIDDATVGQVARGTYTQASDGTLNVTKVRFGKKTGGKTGSKSGGKNAHKDAAATQPEKQ